HGRRGFLDGRRLLGGAFAEVVGAGQDFAGGGAHGARGVAQLAHDVGHARERRVERLAQFLVLAGEYGIDAPGQVAFGHARQAALQLGNDGFGALALGDVGGKFHHLDRPARGVEDRVVGGLQPDFLAALGKAVELAGQELAASQARPELVIFGAAGEIRIGEHAVMPADDLVESIADRGEEILVGLDYGPVELEGNHRLAAGDRVDLASHVDRAVLFVGDV